VQRMRTFTHFMPGERQSCIGCHADRNYESPAGLQGGRSIAAARPAQDLSEPEWGRRDGFSFAQVVQPVLDKRCVRCHDEKSKLDLSGDRSDYFNVAFYGTSQSRQPELRGCRQILPQGLDEVLREVAARRKIDLPRTFSVRLDHPAKNPFLAVPLAKGEFASTADPDYQRILACFAGVREALAQRNHVDYRTVIQACDNQ